MQIVTSVTLFNDAVGLRASVTYSTVEDGKITSDNNRFDRIISDSKVFETAKSIMSYAQEILDAGV